MRTASCDWSDVTVSHLGIHIYSLTSYVLRVGTLPVVNWRLPLPGTVPGTRQRYNDVEI